MKKIFPLLSLIVFLTTNTNAQVKDAAVEQMMTQRYMTCDDIFYNTITLVPKLYREKKMDTLKAVISYCKKNCGFYEAIVGFSILNSIENNTFREELTDTYKDSTKGNSLKDVMFYKNNILSYLEEYKSNQNIEKMPANYPHYAYTAYVDYNNFMLEFARSLLNKPGLGHTERFLVKFYAYPDSMSLRQLDDSLYHGSLIQEAYKDRTKFGGVSYGLNFGQWHPTGQLAVLGDHPFLGAYIGGRGGGFSCDFVMNFGFGDAANRYIVVKDDSIYNTKYFFNYYIGLDFGQALFRTNHSELAFLYGIAYDGIETIDVSSNSNSNANSNATGKVLSSLNLNTGLGYKFYYRHITNDNSYRHPYVALQAKYNFVSYNNNGGTDLTGRSFTFSLIWGMYAKHIHHYYDKN